jgi:hypothetical protein
MQPITTSRFNLEIQPTSGLGRLVRNSASGRRRDGRGYHRKHPDAGRGSFLELQDLKSKLIRQASQRPTPVWSCRTNPRGNRIKSSSLEGMTRFALSPPDSTALVIRPSSPVTAMSQPPNLVERRRLEAQLKT